MNPIPKPPQAYESFVREYPKIAQAWEALREAEKEGPLDHRTIRLIKLAVAMGALREGAVHSSVRKALAAGVSREEILQTVALVVGALGFPSSVAVYSWIQDALD